MEELKKQLNGFGARLNKIENTVGRHDERIKDNKESILAIRIDVAKIESAINSAIWKVLGIVSVPTIMVLYQLINSQK